MRATSGSLSRNAFPASPEGHCKWRFHSTVRVRTGPTADTDAAPESRPRRELERYRALKSVVHESSCYRHKRHRARGRASTASERPNSIAGYRSAAFVEDPRRHLAVNTNSGSDRMNTASLDSGSAQPMVGPGKDRP